MRRAPSLVKKVLFIILTATIGLSISEFAARCAFHKVFPYGEFAIRMLRGEAQIKYQRSIGQSYLNYVPAPKFENEYGLQHNSHGYRGSLVEVGKEPNTLRIVCLGGSTTYGWGVDLPDETYPAHLESILDASPPGDFEDVEVINGGIPWGTSAELLTHYHFKYHYYDPDWVVIHSGLNDAQAFDMDDYHPDYSHWRRQMPSPPILPKPTRWLTRFRLIDFVLIPLLFGSHPETPSFNRVDGARPDIPWFEEERPERDDPTLVPDSNIAFVHNIRTLVDEILSDGAGVALMPVAWMPNVALDKDAWEEIRTQSKNSVRYTLAFEKLLEKISREKNAVFIPFPHGELNSSHWVDNMHVDSAGSRAKAEHVASFIRKEIDRNLKAREHGARTDVAH